MKMGRPVKKRVPGSGEKLFHALKLSGVTWGTRIDVETHILNNDRWMQLGLPRSSNAIHNDIQNGIPEDRLAKYSKFFNVDPEVFISSDIDVNSKKFESSILSSRYSVLLNISFPPFDSDKNFCHTFYINNGPDKNKELFLSLSGIYRFYIKESKNETIYRGVLNFHSKKTCSIIGDGYLKYMDSDIALHVILFQMSTFLHINYYAKEASLLGYGIGMNPFCCPNASLSPHVVLNFCCISGGFVSPAVPDLFFLHAIKETLPEMHSSSGHYARLVAEFAQNPVLDSRDADYAAVATALSQTCMQVRSDS